MNIDFTKQIIEMKEREVLHKPFPCFEGYAVFTKNEEGQIIRMTFQDQDVLKAYLDKLGYDWGNEGKGQYTNFDCEKRLLTVFPDLKDVETLAADPQWNLEKKETLHEKHDLHKSTRTMEDLPHVAVELREVDHPLHWDESNYDSKAKKPDFLKKKKDEKKKKGDKKNGKKGDKKEEDKDDENLPLWLKKIKKKKSESKDYSDLYRKVSGGYGGHLKIGDNVKNVNKDCTHYRSEGVVKGFSDIPGDKGITVAYSCTNSGKSWKEGEVLEKTPDQLEKKD